MKKQRKIKKAILAASALAIFSGFAGIAAVALLIVLGVILAGVTLFAVGCAAVSKLQAVEDK